MQSAIVLIGLLVLVACGSKPTDSGDGNNGGSGTNGRDGGGNSEPDDPFGNAPGVIDAGLAGEPGATPPPGSCGDDCFEAESGAGTDMPFDLEGNPSSGVGVDADGALVLRRQSAAGQELIWIANTSEGTVSKVDTRAMNELARYEVAVNWDREGNENGPSRTSVDSEGNVYAGARFGDSVTKVSALGEDCPDANGDGMITTSTGPGDVLPLGEDDCVQWSTDIGGDARGVAVQEVPGQVLVDTGPDMDITVVPPERYVWVGGQEGEPRLHKLDAETGDILLSIAPPAPVYGLALDGRGNLWIAGKRMDSLARVDTARCLDDSCGDEPVCVTSCTVDSCPDTCDTAVLERIELPGGDTYGITVDCNQRVWLGGAWGGQGVRRYDPLAAAHERLAFTQDIAGSDAEGINGIAADASGFVWGAAGDEGVYRIDSDTMQFVHVAGTGTQEWNAKGLAIDRQGRVWAIPFRLDYAMVITPGMAIDEATVDKPMSGFVGPYTYSDFSGEQRRLAANEPGSYRQLFEGCSTSRPTRWRDLSWEVDAPDGSWVAFFLRTANTLEELEDAEWTSVARAPDVEGPLDLAPFLRRGSEAPGRYIEIEVRLFTSDTGNESRDGCSVTPAVTPRVTSFGVSFQCEPELG